MTREEAALKLSFHLMQCGILMPIGWVDKNGEGSELFEAFKMAQDALREQPRWISVEERLPTPYQNVIVWRDNYLDNSGCVDIDFTFTFNDGDVEWADHMRTWKSVVTHWMPLPMPPKEEV